MNENEFWVAVWKVVAIAFVCAVASMSGCVAYQSEKASEMVKGGADPIDAGCSVGLLSSQTCIPAVIR